jgi:phosphotransacetylase
MLVSFTPMDFEIVERIRTHAAQLGQRVVFTRTQTPGILEAADAMRRSKVAVPILLGNAESIGAIAGRRGLAFSRSTVQEQDAKHVDRYVDLYPARWRAQGIGEIEARLRLLDPDEFGVAMVRAGDADAVIAGPRSSGGTGVPPVVLAAGRAGDCSLLSNSFFVTFSDGPNAITVSDPLTEIEPSPVQLAEIALASARNTRILFGCDPHVAMLQLTAFASLRPRNRLRSVRDSRRETVREAVETIRVRDETIVVDAELQTALESDPGRPNTLVFAEPQSGNLRYRLEQEFEGARVVGPIIQGVDVPVNQLSADASVDDIIDIVAATSVLAANRTHSK